MIKRYIAVIFTLAGILLSSGCGKTVSGGTPTPDPPAKATLIFPAQSSACTTGTVISATQSTITFTWNTSANTDSYELDIKNLLTGAISTQTSTTNSLAVNLLRDTPYSWFVISKSAAVSTTTQSDTWKFYNAGLGTVSHPPFPADNLSPGFGQSVTATGGTINLTWTSADPDNDISAYDVYFGTTATPAISKANIATPSVSGIAVVSGTTYYWKVITKDALGNTSDSGVFQFKVN